MNTSHGPLEVLVETIVGVVGRMVDRAIAPSDEPFTAIHAHGAHVPVGASAAAARLYAAGVRRKRQGQPVRKRARQSFLPHQKTIVPLKVSG